MDTASSDGGIVQVVAAIKMGNIPLCDGLFQHRSCASQGIITFFTRLLMKTSLPPWLQAAIVRLDQPITRFIVFLAPGAALTQLHDRYRILEQGGHLATWVFGMGLSLWLLWPRLIARWTGMASAHNRIKPDIAMPSAVAHPSTGQRHVQLMMQLLEHHNANANLALAAVHQEVAVLPSISYAQAIEMAHRRVFLPHSP